MQRRALLAFVLLALAPRAAIADAALNDAASDAALAFMKALRKKDVEAALLFVDAPFLAEDAQLLATKEDVKAYLTTLLGGIEPSELPNAVLGILDYDQSRAATESKVLKLRDGAEHRRPPHRHGAQQPLARRAAGESRRRQADGGGGGILNGAAAGHCAITGIRTSISSAPNVSSVTMRKRSLEIFAMPSNRPRIGSPVKVG